VDFNLNWIYIAISWILLRWHQLWALAFGAESDVAWILAIVFLVITLRVLLFPVFVKQIKSQRQLQAMQPKMREIREKHKNDRQTASVEMQKLMRESGANPLMGCLPMFLQLPFFFGIFHVLRTIKPDSPSAFRAMTHEYGWSANQFHAASDAKIFGAPIAAAFNSPEDFVSKLGGERSSVQIIAAVLVIIMVISQYITARQIMIRSKAAATASDDASANTQQTVQKVMLYGLPLTLLFSGFFFPIGVVLYQVVNNLFSMSQQFWVIKKMPHPMEERTQVVTVEKAKALAPKPGVKPQRDRATPATAKLEPVIESDKASKIQPEKEKVTTPVAKNSLEASPSSEDKASGSTKAPGSKSKKSKSKGRKGGRI
jgi:YidC/Oxa1 family membrane protein insertase